MRAAILLILISLYVSAFPVFFFIWHQMPPTMLSEEARWSAGAITVVIYMSLLIVFSISVLHLKNTSSKVRQGLTGNFGDRPKRKKKSWAQEVGDIGLTLMLLEDDDKKKRR